MKLIFAGGGTAGHINPALAIASYIVSKEPNTKILYIGAVGGMEEKLVSEYGYDFKGIKISGFSREMSLKGLKKNIITAKRAIFAESECKKIIKNFNPDACIGTGGYVSGPVIRAAQKLHIPTMIHEQNAFPGVTTKMLAPKADKVLLAVDAARKHFKKEYNFVLTGNPIRQAILTVDRENSRKKLGLDKRPVILSFGGSLGARKINEAMAPIIARSGKDGRYQHIHAYGKYGKWFPEKVAEYGTDIRNCSNLDIREYISNMPECLAAADLVICRAGAISLSEIQAQGKASILIPSPNVAENHQYHNAMALVNTNAAAMIEESNLSGESLTKLIDKIISNPSTLKEYEENSRSLAITDASDRIYKELTFLLKKEK